MQNHSEALEKIAPLLADPVRSVRLEAAKVFLGEDPRQLEAGQRMHLAKAMNEFKQSLLAKADGSGAQLTRHRGPFDGEQLEGAALSAAERAIKEQFEATRSRLAKTRLTGVSNEVRAQVQKGGRKGKK